MDFINRNASRIHFFIKSIITEYVSDDFIHILKSFLCKVLNFHIGEKLNGNHNHKETLHKIKGLDYITKDLVLKYHLYADVINDI
ncbi:hypothetical protein GLOIN_2v1764037 [Rhizophagus irregularis DAOM 181602=DAOM 197198]|nr:hypothetical protein RhiirB3_452773 [Rhizophagus irregularis]GET56391.1 hypothetical protein GLOIN_2v1764037 [Rhizophagus irregularis DAOM 181602=DAOM 197198]